MPEKPIVERLVEEGILDTGYLTQEQKEIINTTMTEAEVQALVGIKGKLKFFFWPIKPMMF